MGAQPSKMDRSIATPPSTHPLPEPPEDEPPVTPAPCTQVYLRSVSKEGI